MQTHRIFYKKHILIKNDFSQFIDNAYSCKIDDLFVNLNLKEAQQKTSQNRTNYHRKTM
jgi:hypothetical protein